MKMKLMFLILSLLVVSCVSNTPKDNQQENVKGKWRWQNPDKLNHEVEYEINGGKVYKFDYPNCDAENATGLINDGVCKVEGKTLTFIFDGIASHYQIGWKENGDLTLTSANGRVDIFSIEDGPNDKFYINLDRSLGESPLGTGESVPATKSPATSAPANSGNPF